MDPMDLEPSPRSIGFDADENGQSRQVQRQILIIPVALIEIVLYTKHATPGALRRHGL
jgi:hypothetical protein